MRLSESERKQLSKRRGVHRDKKQAYIEGGEGGRKGGRGREGGGEREGGRGREGGRKGGEREGGIETIYNREVGGREGDRKRNRREEESQTILAD